MQCCSDPYTSIDDPGKRRNKRILWVVLGVVLFIVVAIGIAILIYWLVKKSSSDDLIDNMNIDDLMAHLNFLQGIANGAGNTRAANTTGYAGSLDYVLQQLAQTNYDVQVQYFTFGTMQVIGIPTLIAVSPVFQNPLNFTYGVDFAAMGSFSINGTLTNKHLTYVGLGCTDADWENFPAGDVALIKRGNCTFSTKAAMADKKEAAASLIFNSGDNSANMGIVRGGLAGVGHPVLGCTYNLGTSLQSDDQVTIELTMTTLALNATTANILATTQEGRGDRRIIVGSHLDSVPAGPGINDNGSGSSMNLQLALLVFNHLRSSIQNQITFAWWGAEELGLLGSNFYVSNLLQTNPAALANISLNLNFDMVGSPNFFRGIYNGSSGNDAIKVGSGVIQGLFENAFNDMGLAWDLTDFTGRSDYGPFIAVNISAGGLFTGAEGVKTYAQWQKYGGLTNAAYDPCYHQFCDTVDNVNQQAYLEMAKAGASVLQTLATASDLTNLLQGGSD